MLLALGPLLTGPTLATKDSSSAHSPAGMVAGRLLLLATPQEELSAQALSLLSTPALRREPAAALLLLQAGSCLLLRSLESPSAPGARASRLRWSAAAVKRLSKGPDVLTGSLEHCSASLVAERCQALQFVVGKEKEEEGNA